MRNFVISLVAIAWADAVTFAAPSEVPTPTRHSPATAPAATTQPAPEPAPSESLAPGEAYLEPSKPGAVRHGGFAVVETTLGKEPEPEAPAPAVRAPRGPDLVAQESNETYQEALKKFLRPFGIYPEPDGSIPLTGDVVQALCDYGPGHPFLCPTKYLGEIIKAQHRHPTGE